MKQYCWIFLVLFLFIQLIFCQSLAQTNNNKHQKRRLSNVWGKRSLERRLSSTWGKRGISSNSDENVLDDLCEQYLLTRRLQEPASRKHEMQHLNSDESNPEVHELYRQPNYLEHTDQEPNEDTSIDETRNLSS